MDSFIAFLQKEVKTDYANVVAANASDKHIALLIRYTTELEIALHEQASIHATMQHWIVRCLCMSCCQQELYISQTRQLTMAVKCAILQNKASGFTLTTHLADNGLKARFQTDFDNLYKA